MAHCSVLQVECKKAQPKEVMLPANLAKGRAATRGLGELLMVSPGAGVLQTFRYSPYTIPATNPPPSSSSSSPTSALYTQSLLQPQLHHLLGLDHAQHHQNQLALTHLLGGQLGLASCKPSQLTFPSQLGTAGLTQFPNGQTSLGQFQSGLGYNLSDLLSLQGLHGLQGFQVPVGL
jgi:RNA-binding protein Musashi